MRVIVVVLLYKRISVDGRLINALTPSLLPEGEGRR